MCWNAVAATHKQKIFRYSRIAGFTIRYSSEEQMIYEFIIDGYYMHFIHECNELLTSNGFKELTGVE